MKRFFILVLPLILFADDATLQKRVDELESKVKLLEKNDQEHYQDIKEMTPIVEKTEMKSILDKIDFSPELELRVDKFDYSLGKIAGEDTRIYGNPDYQPDGTYQRRDEFSKHFDPAGYIRVRLNMRAQLDEKVNFYGRMVFVTSSQSYQRLCILSRDIKSVSVSSAFDIERAYFDYSADKSSPDAFTFSFGVLPTTGGTPMQFAQNTKRKSMFPALVFDMNTYGMIATQKFNNDTFIRAIAAKAYTMRGQFYPYQCNRENIDNADVFGIYADTKFKFFGDALLSGGFNYLYNLKAHPYLGPDVSADNAHVLGNMMTLGIGLDVENVDDMNLKLFAHSAMSIPDGNGNIDDYKIVNDVNGTTTSGTVGFSTADYAKGPMVSSNGYAFYTGTKYGLNESFDLGLEYNYGSKYWFSATQGAEDIYNKLSTRGHVGEAYLIWKFHNNLYTKLGYMYAKEEYTGSGWHFGEPVSKDGTQQIGYFSINAKY